MVFTPPIPLVPPKVIVYQKNAQIFEMDGLQDSAGSFLNSATVTMTLIDQNGHTVAGIENVPMVYVGASNGIYQGAIPASFDPTTGQGYQLVVDAAQGAAVGHWQFPVQVDIRRT